MKNYSKFLLERIGHTRTGIAITILCLAIFLIRLPPFYILPIGSLFHSHNLSRILLISLMPPLFFSKIIIKYKSLVILIALYILTQTASLIGAVNMGAFLSVYKDVIFSVMIFMITVFYIKKQDHGLVMMTLISSTVVNIIFQLLIYIYPFVISSPFQNFFYHKYWDMLTYQINRNRFFGDSFDELTLPLFLIQITQTRGLFQKLAGYAVIGGILFITLVSNWRTKTFMLILVLVWSSFKLLNIRNKTALFLIVAFVMLVANPLTLSYTGTNVIDRFLVEDSTIQASGGRLQYWKEASQLGLDNPFYGVGLGNYYENISQRSQVNNNKSIIERQIIIDDPHNIFFSVLATSGIPGLTSIISLIVYFAISDFRNRNSLALPYIIMFWGLLLFSLLNPFQYASFLFYFWFLRGIATAYTSYEKE